MAILIKLLAAGLDLGAAIEFEGFALIGGVAAVAGVGRYMVRPRLAGI